MPRSSSLPIRHKRRSHIVRDVVLIVSICVGMLYLIRLIECRSKLPSSRVVAMVYDQTNDTFSLETRPIPWWSVRELSREIEIRTKGIEGEQEGLYPHPRFRSREIVDYPDPSMDQHFPGYVLSNDLPEGKSYSPTKKWQMVRGIRWRNGQWNLTYESVELNDTVIQRPIQVRQFRNDYPAQSPDDNEYDFYIRPMGGLMARGHGRMYEPKFHQLIHRAMMNVFAELQ